MKEPTLIDFNIIPHPFMECVGAIDRWLGALVTGMHKRTLPTSVWGVTPTEAWTISYKEKIFDIHLYFRSDASTGLQWWAVEETDAIATNEEVFQQWNGAINELLKSLAPHIEALASPREVAPLETPPPLANDRGLENGSD